jgi:hypothetical protein
MNTGGKEHNNYNEVDYNDEKFQSVPIEIQNSNHNNYDILLRTIPMPVKGRY